MPPVIFSKKRYRVFAALVVVGMSFMLTLVYLLKYGEVEKVTLNTALVRDVLHINQGEKTARLLFVGDIMLDRTIRGRVAEDGGLRVFSGVRSLLQSAHMVVGNLEGPITTHASVSLLSKVGEPNNTRFTFDPSAAATLFREGFTLLAIGNNHIADFGREGASSTRTYLEIAGVSYVGDPFDSNNTLVWQEVQGFRVAFVGYNEFIVRDAEGARAAVGRAREEGADFIIVLAHWGDEYTAVPPPRVRQFAATLAAAGADLIIGTHSHVIGEIEDLGRTRVYYSLGNFIFDQYWDTSVRCGLVVELEITKGVEGVTPSYRTHETYLERDGSTSLGCPLSQTGDTQS